MMYLHMPDDHDILGPCMGRCHNQTVGVIIWRHEQSFSPSHIKSLSLDISPIYIYNTNNNPPFINEKDPTLPLFLDPWVFSYLIILFSFSFGWKFYCLPLFCGIWWEGKCLTWVIIYKPKDEMMQLYIQL